MITLEQPSLALNDERHGHMTVQMWQTKLIKKDDTVDYILNLIAAIAKQAPDKKLKNLVFSCHGDPACLYLGEGVSLPDTRRFSHLAGLVEKIWIRACRVAFVESAGTTADGNLFCSEIARYARCYVIASTEVQVTRPTIREAFFKSFHHTLPFGQLDSFEGLVLSYGPSGKITWSQRYGSGKDANNE